MPFSHKPDELAGVTVVVAAAGAVVALVGKNEGGKTLSNVGSCTCVLFGSGYFEYGHRSGGVEVICKSVMISI